MKPEPIAFLNGEFLPLSQAVLRPDDAGFLYGATVVDRLRTFAGKMPFLDRHLRRFVSSCRAARVPLAMADSDLHSAVAETLSRNAAAANDTEWSIVLLATPGPQTTGKPTVGIHVQPLDLSRLRPLIEKGAILEFSPAVIDPGVLDPNIKHRSRLHWWIAEAELRARGSAAMPLLVTSTSPPLIRETPTANFLAVIGDQVVSPPRSQILDGISLGVVRELCLDLAIPFLEREIAIEEVLDTTGECLLTNTTFGIVGVGMVQGRTKPFRGPVLERLLAAYSQRAGVDLRGQILASAKVAAG